MQSIFIALLEKFGTPARCAAAAGMSRQAYHQATARNSLAPLNIVRAALALGIDPAAAILDAIAALLPSAERAALRTTPHPAPPIPHPTPQPPRQPDDYDTAQTLHYVKSDRKKKQNDQQTKKITLAHFPTSQERKDAINVIRWVWSVAGLPADSPRFSHYVSRWDVPAKIARAVAAGTFDEITANCPPIDPAWVRFVPAALEEHRQFAERYKITSAAKSSSTRPDAVQLIFSIRR